MKCSTLALAGLQALTVFAGGCASPSGRAGLSTWEMRVEERVADSGHGDLNVLRVAAPDSPVPMFGVLGGAEPEGSTDVAGLLLGKRASENRVWYFFLVAAIEDQQIRAIRLVAVSARAAADAESLPAGDRGHAEDQGLEWRVGPGDPDTFTLYRQSIAQFIVSPDPLARWKSGVDRFDLAGTGSRWRATHAASGAVWTVDTAAAKAAVDAPRD